MLEMTDVFIKVSNVQTTAFLHAAQTRHAYLFIGLGPIFVPPVAVGQIDPVPVALPMPVPVLVGMLIVWLV